MALTSVDVQVVVSYIGGSGGYLGNFSYPSHADFYPKYCDLAIDPKEYTGTTRTRFMTILSKAKANDQAKILRGVLEKFSLEHFESIGIDDKELEQK